MFCLSFFCWYCRWSSLSLYGLKMSSVVMFVFWMNCWKSMSRCLSWDISVSSGFCHHAIACPVITGGSIVFGCGLARSGSALRPFGCLTGLWLLIFPSLIFFWKNLYLANLIANIAYLLIQTKPYRQVFFIQLAFLMDLTYFCMVNSIIIRWKLVI